MITLKPIGDKLMACAYVYMLIPVLLFLVGWLRWYYALPLCGGLIYGFIQAVFVKSSEDVYKIKINRKLILILTVLAAWVVLSGIGGFVWQNRWDHAFRNTVFMELYRNAWPVVNNVGTTTEILCYYIGFWLPSAVVAKITSSVTIGYLCQTLYAYIGVVISILLLFRKMKTVKYRIVIIFIFFSGLDAIIYFLLVLMGYMDFMPFSEYIVYHHELWLEYFNSSSNTTLLFWTYNQIVPFWVGAMILLHRWNETKILLFTFSLLMLGTLFPFVALFPLIIYRCMKEIRQMPNLITPANLSGIILMLIIALYFSSNSVAGYVFLLPDDLLFRFGCFIVVEFVVFMPFIWWNIKTDKVFWILFGTMVTCNIVRLGANDFSWRTTIPLAFYIMLKLMEEINKINRFNLKAVGLAIVMLVGAITPIQEITRVCQYTLFSSDMDKETFRSPWLNSIFDKSKCRDYFVATGDSFFTEYLMKEPSIESE